MYFQYCLLYKAKRKLAEITLTHLTAKLQSPIRVVSKTETPKTKTED